MTHINLALQKMSRRLLLSPVAQPLILLPLLLTCALSATICLNCGPTAVPYPFSTGPTCGDPSYKIRCVAGSLIFDSINNSYPITSINPSTQRLVIRPAPLLPSTCVASDLPNQGLQLNTSLPFNITGDNTVMFLNCTDTLLGSPLNCTSSSLCHVYVNNTASESACRNAGLCCTFRAGGSTTSYTIRLRDGACRAYTSFVNLDPGLPLAQWPSPGVAIQWMLPQEPLCRTQTDCDRNATCAPDPSSSSSTTSGSNRGVNRCYCSSGLLWDPIRGICAKNITCQDPGGCDDSAKTALIAGLTSGLGVALVAVIVGILAYKRHRRMKEARERLVKEREAILNAGGNRAAKIFTGKHMKKATNNFSKDRLIGAGGYGEVYKGFLDDGTVVAVKCAKLGNAKGPDQVLNEVRILCQVNHKSLVHLLGCCVDLQQPILVYEYISNGNLYDHLHDERQLSWIHRLRIAQDTAQGLAYLHFSAVPPIYHRDVKSSNILLDDKLNAKVSDFGLSRLAHSDMSHISTCAQGTLGYLDPEYYRKYQLTDKSDVYSFGVVLLELLTSQKAIDFNREEDDVNLAVYVQTLMQEERLMDAIHPALKEKASDLQVQTIKALAFLALNCLEEKRQNRPSMKEVAEEIEYIITIAAAKAVDI